MLLIDNMARKVPIAKIDVDTPYLKGQVEVQCLPNAVYDLIVGNVPALEPLTTQTQANTITYKKIVL